MPDQKDTLDAFVRPSIHSDIDWIAERLRQADINELDALGVEAKTALLCGYELSKNCFTGVCNDEPFIMFGANEVQEDVGAIWLLGTDLVTKASIPFLKQSRKWLAVFHEDFPLLFNYVDARNTVHIRWLRWLDFKFIRLHQEFGAARLPFYEFVRIK